MIRKITVFLSAYYVPDTMLVLSLWALIESSK